MTKKLKWVPVYHPCGKCEVSFDFCRCEIAGELEFLRYFYGVAFGSGEKDKRLEIKEMFAHETGKLIPDGYKED